MSQAVRESVIADASVPQGDHARVAAAARLVGLREFETPTLEAVERRRVQLWLIAVLTLIGVTAIVFAGSLFPRFQAGPEDAWFAGTHFRVLLTLLTAGFGAYVLDKERHLRKLTRLLVDERVLTTALTDRLAETNAMLQAGKAINSVLELDAVLDIILQSATGLLDAPGGSIMLADQQEAQLRSVCTHGSSSPVGASVGFGEGVAGRVAATQEPLLVTGDLGTRLHAVDSAMSVPLVHRGVLLGVLNLNASPGRQFTEYDLRALSLFAEQAAAAITNARLYEIERQQVADLVAAETRKSEFLAAVSHDLRTPLTSLIGCARMLQRPALRDDQRAELTAMLDRQAVRLSQMIEDLLTSARIESELPPELEPVDLVTLLHELRDEYAVTDRPVGLTLPDEALVLAQPEGLRRVFTNLVDNAFKYGAQPVSIDVTPTADGRAVLAAVRDSGAGIRAEDRERVFERFTRLEGERRVPGIGLGLSIVRGLVVSFGGDVHVNSGAARSGGTAIVVRLQTAR